MKYIVEIKPDCEGITKGIIILGTSEDKLYVDALAVEELEVLNADYINEHFGDLQDTAYQRGLEEGKKATFELVADASNAEYQRGLNEAWECGKKLAWTAKYGGYGERLNGVFGRDDTFDFYDYTPNEAIEKLKAFEQKQDKIEVGDEVNWLGDYFIVTRIFQPRNMKEQCDGIDDDGCVCHGVLIKDLEKTGRHFDIQKILEAMKHD